MQLANKYDIISDVKIVIDGLADAKGVSKCVKIVDVIQRLDYLEKVLKDEDSNHEAAIKELTSKIDESGKGNQDENNNSD